VRTLMTTPAVIRRHLQGTDPYGNQTRTGEYTDTEVRCWLTPQSAGGDAEDRTDREQVTYLFKLFVAGHPDLRHTDQVIVDSETSEVLGSGDDTPAPLTVEVVGAPFAYRDRTGRVHHVEAICRRVEG